MKTPLLHSAFALAALLAGSAVFAQPLLGASASRSDLRADRTGAALFDATDVGARLYDGQMLDEHRIARIAWEHLRVAFPGAQKDDVDLRYAGVTYRFCAHGPAPRAAAHRAWPVSPIETPQ